MKPITHARRRGVLLAASAAVGSALLGMPFSASSRTLDEITAVANRQSQWLLGENSL